jgi:hypothetical protein
MHGALIDISLMLSVAVPAQLEPEVIVKPPIGVQELMVVGGTAGCGATSRQPLTIAIITTNGNILIIFIRIRRISI